MSKQEERGTNAIARARTVPNPSPALTVDTLFMWHIFAQFTFHCISLHCTRLGEHTLVNTDTHTHMHTYIFTVSQYLYRSGIVFVVLVAFVVP